MTALRHEGCYKDIILVEDWYTDRKLRIGSEHWPTVLQATPSSGAGSPRDELEHLRPQLTMVSEIKFPSGASLALGQGYTLPREVDPVFTANLLEKN